MPTSMDGYEAGEIHTSSGKSMDWWNRASSNIMVIGLDVLDVYVDQDVTFDEFSRTGIAKRMKERYPQLFSQYNPFHHVIRSTHLERSARYAPKPFYCLSFESFLAASTDPIRC